jgi:hypothetical protein
VADDVKVGELVPTKGEAMTRPKRAWDLMPASLGDAMEIGKMIADSDFAPKDYRGKPANVVIAIQMGADVGLKPLQALQSIAVVNGKPSIYGDAALALALSSGQIESLKETDDGTAAKCIIKRKGLEPVERTFSMDDAKTAGLLGKAGPWTNYPKRMRQMRARGFALRDAVPDLLMGLGLVEEAQDYAAAVDVTVVASDPFLALTEEHQGKVDQAFEALNLSPANRRVLIQKHLPGEAPEAERVEALLDELRDEYTKRKTGKPRSKKPVEAAKEPEPAKKEPEPEQGGAAENAQIDAAIAAKEQAEAAEKKPAAKGSGFNF